MEEESNECPHKVELSQTKRLRLPRSEKKRLLKEKRRESRRIKRREKRRNSRKRHQEERKEFLTNMTEDERRSFIISERQEQAASEKRRGVFLQKAYDNGLPICINCAFHDEMDEIEGKSLAKQLSFVYNDIKNERAMVKLILTGIDMQSPLYSYMQLFGVDSWKVHKHQENYWDIYDVNNVIVLSPDAELFLEDIDMDKIYVIGGLVDKHIKRNATLTQAKRYGFTTRALPIPTYFPECKRKVLSIDAVFHILVMRANNSTWQEAFQANIPTRAKIDT